MTQAIGKASMDLVGAMTRYVEENAQGADRILVSVPAGDLAAQSRQSTQPGQMGAAPAQQMELAVNPAALTPYITGILPSLTHMAFAYLDREYGGALRAVLEGAGPQVQPLLAPDQWDKLRELIEILDPRTLQAVAHPRVMQAIKS